MKGLVVPIEITVARLEKQLANVVNKAQNSAGKMQDAFVKGNQKTEKSFKRSGFAVANLSAQLNDIGVSLAGGQSPFQVMIQQGTQVSQIFQQTGGNMKNFTELLKGSVLGVLNPFSIATFAIIGFGGAILQWFTKTEDVSKDTAESIKELESAIKAYESSSKDAAQPSEELASKYGLATSEARKLLQINMELSQIDALDKLSATLKSIGTDVDSFFSVSQNIADIRKSIDSIQAAKEQLESTGSTFLNIDAATSKNVELIARKFSITVVEAQSLFDILSRLSSAKGPEEQLAVFDELLPRIKETSGGVEGMSDEMRKLYGEFVRAAQGAAVLAGEAASIAPGLEEAADAAKRLADELHDASKAAASAVESARGKLQDANIELQYKNDPVSLAAAKAELDFTRKAGDTSGFDPIVKGVFEAQKEEIIAVATETAKARIQLDEYRKAQAKLKREASKTPKQTPDQKFDVTLANADRRADSIAAEYEALLTLNPLVNDYGQALEYARVKQTLLNQAEKASVELTPARLAAMEAIAQRSAMGVVQINKLAESHTSLKNAAVEFKNGTKNILSGLISDFRNGVSASEALANALGKVADKLTDIALNAAIDGIDLSSIFSSVGGSGAPRNIIPSGGLAEGGYTGAGHKYQVKGTVPVHGNEYVMPSHAVDKIGVKNLDKLSRSGFANGGYTGGSGGSGKGGFGSPKIEINNYQSGEVDVTAKQDPLTGVIKLAVEAVKKDYSEGGFDSMRSSRTGVKTTRKSR